MHLRMPDRSTNLWTEAQQYSQKICPCDKKLRKEERRESSDVRYYD